MFANISTTKEVLVACCNVYACEGAFLGAREKGGEEVVSQEHIDSNSEFVGTNED